MTNQQNIIIAILSIIAMVIFVILAGLILILVHRYKLSVTNIRFAKGVESRGGPYQWTVGIVQVNPNYVDYGLEADPAHLQYVLPTNKTAESD